MSCALLGLVLMSCAPTQIPVGPPTVFTGQELAQICAQQPRIGESGRLVWGTQGDEEVQDAPYQIQCPDYAFSNTTGKAVVVKARSIESAFYLFLEESLFLNYFGDMQIRLKNGMLIADNSLTSVPSNYLKDFYQLRIYAVTDDGKETALFKGGQAIPYPIDGPPFTIKFNTQNWPVPWNQVRFDPKNATITAQLP